MPTAVAMLNTAALSPLKLSVAQVLDQGRRNMRPDMVKALAGMADAAPSEGVVGMVGEDYEASLLAFPDLWAPIAAKFGGDLFVAAPAKNIVVFCRTKHRGALKAITKAATDAAAQSEQPLPVVVLRWTPEGWEGAGDAAGN